MSERLRLQATFTAERQEDMADLFQRFTDWARYAVGKVSYKVEEPTSYVVEEQGAV